MSVRSGTFNASILLVDADDDTRQLHRMVLDDIATTIEEACDGVEAYGRALSHPPDVVVTELRLPRMDGRTLVERLRRDPRLEACSILVVSGSAHGLIRNDLLRLGADAVLLKPCDPREIVHAVERLAWGRRQTTPMATSGADVPKVQPSETVDVLRRGA